jgi:hypothetical protein
MDGPDEGRGWFMCLEANTAQLAAFVCPECEPYADFAGCDIVRLDIGDPDEVAAHITARGGGADVLSYIGYLAFRGDLDEDE